jgi:hypothetical protein
MQSPSFAAAEGCSEQPAHAHLHVNASFLAVNGSFKHILRINLIFSAGDDVGGCCAQ